MYKPNDLSKAISKKTQKMIHLAFKKGFTNKETVECSGSWSLIR
ncbi:aspartyl-phosphate phosphatase Spo0E family protein [Lentibacillus sp. L22]|nr:aspartyl-phosphate phosphatase Spo0E family protein [Lentibacillus daqui]